MDQPVELPSGLHEIILPIGRPLLIATRCHCLVGEQIIICMVALVCFLLSLTGQLQFLLLPCLLRCSFAISELLKPVFTLLMKVRELFDFGLVESVHDRIFAFLDVDALNLWWMVSLDVTGRLAGKAFVAERKLE